MEQKNSISTPEGLTVEGESRKVKIVSFTGHRPDKMSQWSQAPDEVERSVRRAVATEILSLVERGATTFLCGMAPGFDLWAADELLRLKIQGRVGCEVRLVAVVPYPTFCRSFGSVVDQHLYEQVAAHADEVIYSSPHYHHGCYNLRNDFLADNADTLVAYYEGYDGGTRYTLRRAQKRGIRCINLFEKEIF